MDPEQQTKLVVDIAKTILQGTGNRYPTEDDLKACVDGAIRAIQNESALSEELSEPALRILRSEVTVFIEDATILENREDHEPWLKESRRDIAWTRWNLYRRWMLKQLPGAAVDSLDQLTDDILSRLERPGRSGDWDRRGMVVGEVQAGKTANYTGLICKAADAGYKLIIVLAGLHNSLRSQTQQRIDAGFIGLESELIQAGNKPLGGRVGVGTLLDWRSGGAMTLTSSRDSGDFSLANAQQGAGGIGGAPIVLVIKKNKSVLENLINWVETQSLEHLPGAAAPTVPDLPLLVIDDEADNASVNIKDVEYDVDENGMTVAETDPSRINGLIRDLLKVFQKKAYVGYTATPFANIFIAGAEQSVQHGDDLFPRSFIVRMKSPSNHIGPARVFGLQGGEGEEQKALPTVHAVDDTDGWLEQPHKKEATPGVLAPSLREAMLSFILATAARRARGQTRVHSSMLIHVTRFVAVQARVCEQVEEELARIRNRIKYGESSGSQTVLERLEDLWQSDFEPTIRDFPQDLRESPIDWPGVEAELDTVVSGIVVRQINGSVGDTLAYKEHADGLNVIAIGGDKLSRGLTLEGLSVSYYLRASRMYDTLMQMGRWFGYRAGYTDLCRLYTTQELITWYRGITDANLELLDRFDRMADSGSNPEDFALYVRESPEGLLITAPAKMRDGASMKLSFSDSTIETIKFSTDPDTRRANLSAVEQLLGPLGPPGKGKAGNHIWHDVPGGSIVSMLERFKTVEQVHKAHADLLALYITNRINDQELTDWTVLLVNNSQKTPLPTKFEVADLNVGLTYRGRDSRVDPAVPGIYQIRRVGSPLDEAADLSADEYQRALVMTQERYDRNESMASERPTQPASAEIRSMRPATNGLLVIYPLDPKRLDDESGVPMMSLLFGFPESSHSASIAYKVPSRYTREQFALDQLS